MNRAPCVSSGRVFWRTQRSGWLNFNWNGPIQPHSVVHASDYFGPLYAWAEHLVTQGLAYVDDSDAETITAQRGSLRACTAAYTARAASTIVTTQP